MAKFLAGLLKPFGGKGEFHGVNSAAFVESLDSLRLTSGDLLVSLDIVSLFPKVPLGPTFRLLGPLFLPEVANLFCFVLRSTFPV